MIKKILPFVFCFVTMVDAMEIEEMDQKIKQTQQLAKLEEAVNSSINELSFVHSEEDPYAASCLRNYNKKLWDIDKEFSKTEKCFSLYEHASQYNAFQQYHLAFREFIFSTFSIQGVLEVVDFNKISKQVEEYRKEILTNFNKIHEQSLEDYKEKLNYFEYYVTKRELEVEKFLKNIIQLDFVHTIFLMNINHSSTNQTILLETIESKILFTITYTIIRTEELQKQIFTGYDVLLQQICKIQQKIENDKQEAAQLLQTQTINQKMDSIFNELLDCKKNGPSIREKMQAKFDALVESQNKLRTSLNEFKM